MAAEAKVQNIIRLTASAQGKTFMSVVTLRPEVHFSGALLPTHAQIGPMHHEAHEAHEECFIANSVKTEIRCVPVYVGHQ